MELIIFIPVVSFAVLLSAFLGLYSLIAAFKQHINPPEAPSVAGKTAIAVVRLTTTGQSKRHVVANGAVQMVLVQVQ